MDSPYTRELTVAIGALQKAAQLSQSIVSNKDKGAIEKDDLSPVTVADFAVQALLTATIKHAFPEDRVVGEEDASDLRQNSVLMERVWELLGRVARDEDTASLCKLPETREQMCDLIDECGASSPSPAGRTWIFDPIDGTKTYLLGQLYAINMALLVDGEQAVGIVGAPNLSIDAKGPLKNEDIDPTGEGCIFFGVKGHGAYIRPLHSDQPRRLSIHAANQEISFVTSATMVDSAMTGIHDLVASRLNSPYPGSDLLPWVLRWAVLAMGLGNTTLWVYKKRDRYAKVWDHAGAMLLFEEAGGKITDVHGKAIDLTAGRKISKNFGFVGAPEDIHGRVLEVVREVLTEQGKEEFLK
ncbi:3'(2'),5'-bisphosphate nucleotidase [Fusarium austroafricanum]|uniref:3'(2'),5'-bisphosphate nucleotidase n=1 Tax=Fusarium austroafricanum TaxID=2364996 RepID=A0A8H4KER6_9HYPO|nr:3'(2'),5'-bisphosphate nucleotidase [Fusarium austroafricanum]